MIHATYYKYPFNAVSYYYIFFILRLLPSFIKTGYNEEKNEWKYIHIDIIDID